MVTLHLPMLATRNNGVSLVFTILVLWAIVPDHDGNGCHSFVEAASDDVVTQQPQRRSRWQHSNHEDRHHLTRSSNIHSHRQQQYNLFESFGGKRHVILERSTRQGMVAQRFFQTTKGAASTRSVFKASPATTSTAGITNPTTRTRIAKIPSCSYDAMCCFAAGSNASKKKKKTNNNKAGGGFGGSGGSGGFGSPSGGSSSSSKSKGGGLGTTTSPSTVLSTKAKQLLKKHGNNVDAASSDYFASQMQNYGQTAGSSFDDTVTTTATAPATTTSNTVEELHAVKVKATWDTVALFLPCDYARTKGKVEPYVDRRLQHIVEACRGGRAAGDGSSEDSISLLDVGCGDGAIIPYLESATGNSHIIEYMGLDVSTEMIKLGQRQHPSYEFMVGSFPEVLYEEKVDGETTRTTTTTTTTTDKRYDTILFNGSLQFFRDTFKVLQQARHLLRDGNHSRIVLAHVQGAKFVKDECRTSQGVAVRTMPNNSSLEDYAKLLGMRVLFKNDLFLPSLDHEGTTTSNMLLYDPKLDGEDDEFYLVALETL